MEEGGISKLSPELFSVYSPFYAEKITEFKVKKSPQHGWLQYIGSSSITGNISKWTSFQLQNQQIQVKLVTSGLAVQLKLESVLTSENSATHSTKLSLYVYPPPPPF